MRKASSVISENREWVFSGIGVAIVLAFIPTLISGFSKIPSMLVPDVIVRVQVVENTLPPDIAEWFKKIPAANRDAELLYKTKGISNRETRKDALVGDALKPLISPIAKKLDFYYNKGFKKYIVELENQSNKPVSDAKLRLDNVYALWSADAEGTFLSPDARLQLISQIEKGHSNDSIVLSKLPTLPAKSDLKLVLYADNYSSLFNKLEFSVSGHSSDVRTVRQLEDSLLADWAANPHKPFEIIIFILLIGGYSSWAFGMPIYHNKLSQIRRDASAKALYAAGCRFAYLRKDDEAMLLLKRAVDTGYSNNKAALSDPNLNDLRNREDFQNLFPNSKD
ncbi:TPR end-of-group domain-containing protein [Romeriopsis navalis]|nr:hypothetical protein [Romeriopsis navalis]